MRWLANVQGMRSYLFAIQVLLKDFSEHVQGVTERIRQVTTELAETAGRPVVYLSSSAQSKEHVARQIQQRDGITQGLICVLSCVEPCWTYEVARNRSQKLLELRGKYGKCLHCYFYLQDPAQAKQRTSQSPLYIRVISVIRGSSPMRTRPDVDSNGLALPSRRRVDPVCSVSH